jgi:hypothetical protein
MSERAELIIDTVDINADNILFLTPNHIRGVRYCASNIFDYASINNCPTEKLNSSSLISIFNSLKPGAEIYIVINQPILVMLECDSKQIEANLKLVGFEDIKYEETISSDKKNGAGTLVGTLSAIKPVNKERDRDKQIEIIKSEKQYSYNNINNRIIDNERKKEKNKRRDDREDEDDMGGYGGYSEQNDEEDIKEEPISKYKKSRIANNNINNVEKNEEEIIYQKKYNRFEKEEEEEDNPVKSKRFRYSRPQYEDEKPQTIDAKYEAGGETKGKYRRFPRTSPGSQEVVIEKTTFVEKSDDFDNKKVGLRKKYGKH